MSLLQIEKLSIRYGDDIVVRDVSFSVGAGESVGLVGESGSGKTQTALAALGLLPENATTSGCIRVAGTNVLGASDKTINALRAQKMAIVFQDPLQALNPYLTIGARRSRRCPGPRGRTRASRGRTG